MTRPWILLGTEGIKSLKKWSLVGHWSCLFHFYARADWASTFRYWLVYTNPFSNLKQHKCVPFLEVGAHIDFLQLFCRTLMLIIILSNLTSFLFHWPVQSLILHAMMHANLQWKSYLTLNCSTIIVWTIMFICITVTLFE